jgi:molybdopterin-binding protein
MTPPAGLHGHPWSPTMSASIREAKTMEISARNQLEAIVKAVRTGDLMAEVVLGIGDQEIVSVITRASAEHLGLKVGDAVVAIIKSTEVMLGK